MHVGFHSRRSTIPTPSFTPPRREDQQKSTRIRSKVQEGVGGGAAGGGQEGGSADEGGGGGGTTDAAWRDLLERPPWLLDDDAS